MLSISELLKSLHDDYREIKIKEKEHFDFNKEDEAYLIKAGEILSYGDRNLTQLMGKYDPIGFCETILARKKVLRYRRISDLHLLGFNGPKIRKDINDSHVVVKSIIQYSLSRIFENSKSKSHQLFEEGFIHQNIKYFSCLWTQRRGDFCYGWYVCSPPAGALRRVGDFARRALAHLLWHGFGY